MARPRKKPGETPASQDSRLDEREPAAAEEQGPAEEKKAPRQRRAAAKPSDPKPAAKAKKSETARKATGRAAKPARAPLARTPKPERPRGQRKERRGVVVSAAMDKTIVVRVDTAKPHPRYKKIVRRSAKLHAHDDGNSAKVGDVVRVVETRPLSRMKRWRLAEVVEEAK